MKQDTLEGKAKQKNGVKRLCFSIVCILLEVVFIITIVTRLNEYAEIINLFTRILSGILVLGLYASDKTSSMKMPWVILILIFPIMGVGLYLLIGLNGGTHKMRERYAEIDSKLLPMLSDNQECLNRINETIPKAGNIASYIQRNSQYPIYQNTDIVYFNAKLLEPITRLSKAMKEVSRGDFEQHLETNSRIAEVGESYQSFNVMTKELRATEVLQMDFVSDVSHEFKTPINAIEGYTMLLQGEELSPDQEEYVEKILFNTQRLSGLVGNILLLSKLENQNIPMKKTEYRLDEQIRQAVLSLETKWTEKEIGFQVELEEVKYTANEGLFMHIWINLLDNAIKFSPSKGTITMFLKQEQDSVKFILEDEGPGIEDDVKSRIFDKFYQVDGSHKAEGNGLGLALVKRIVDSAGGTIKAENREYGGCRFVIELPKQKDEII